MINHRLSSRNILIFFSARSLDYLSVFCNLHRFEISSLSLSLPCALAFSFCFFFLVQFVILFSFKSQITCSTYTRFFPRRTKKTQIDSSLVQIVHKLVFFFFFCLLYACIVSLIEWGYDAGGLCNESRREHSDRGSTWP